MRAVRLASFPIKENKMDRHNSSGYMAAFMFNLAAFLINLGLALVWHHQDKFELMVVNGMCAAFSGILAMFNLCRYFDAAFKNDQDETYRRIYGKRY
jgi:hypothetical protein